MADYISIPSLSKIVRCNKIVLTCNKIVFRCNKKLEMYAKIVYVVVKRRDEFELLILAVEETLLLQSVGQ